MVQARKWIALFLALIMVVGMFPATGISVSAEENGAQTSETQLLQTEATTEPTQGDIMPTETKEELAEASIDAASGTCGANLNWTLDENGLLTISGKGPMYNYGVGDAPWSSRHNITSVIISQGVTSISDSAFYNCKNLQSIEIAQTVTEIGAGAFSWCRSLTSIEIPEGVTQIKSNTFYECTSLADINLPDSLTKIEDEAFKNCCVLTNVTLPEGLTRISHEAFADCTGLERITIPSTVTYLGVQVFRNCPGLKEILVSEGNTVYYSKNGVLFFRNNLYRYPPACTETAYSIPDGITIIDNYAFEHASVLTSLTVPATVNTFMTSAFAGCTSLMELYYAGTQKQWDSISILDGNDVLDDVALYCQGNPVIDSGICGDNLTWTLDENGLLTISGTGAMTSAPWREREDFRYEITSLSIAEGVTEICHMAFYSLYDLTEAVIPASVTEIGGTAFANSGVTRVEILGATGIQSYAFNSCSNLETLVLNKDIPWIGQQAFENISLTEIYFSGTEEAWDTFLRINAREGMGNDALRNVTNVVCNWEIEPEEELPENACGKKLTWEYANGVLTISGSGDMFDYTQDNPAPWSVYCADIESIELGDAVTSIGNFAFAHCIKVIGFLGRSVTRIGDFAFWGCTELLGIVFPEDSCITEIGRYAFWECTNVYTMTLDGPLEIIRSGAFLNCTALKTISLPKELQTIEDYAFFNCDALIEATYDGTEDMWNQVNVGSHNEKLLNVLNYERRFDVEIKDGILTQEWNRAFYKFKVTIDNNSTKTELTNVQCGVNPGRGAVLEHDSDVQKVTLLGPGEKAVFEWSVRIDRNTYSDGGSHEIQITASADGTEFVLLKDSVALDAINGQDNSLDFETDVWKFVNWRDKPVCDITEEHKAHFLQGLSPTDIALVSEWNAGVPGHCYGMSATVILEKMNIVDMSRFTGASTIHEAKKGSHDTHSILCYYQNTQRLSGPLSDRQNYMELDTDDQLLMLATKVNRIKTGGTPVLFGFGSGKGSHAVVAYALERGSFRSSETGIVYNNRVLLYDSNAWGPLNGIHLDEDNCFLFNDDTEEHPWAWEIPEYVDDYGFYSGNPDAYLCRCTNDLNIIDVNKYTASAYNYNAELRLQRAERIILENIESGQQWTVDGAEGCVQGDSDLITYYDEGVVEDSIPRYLNVVLPDENARYRIISVDDGNIGMDVRVLFDDRYVSVVSDNNISTVLSSTGTVKIDGNAGKFEIMIADDNIPENAFNTFSVAGNTEGDITVGITDEGLEISGNNLSGVTIEASEGKISDSITITDSVDIVTIGRENEKLDIASAIKKDLVISQEYVAMQTGKSVQLIAIAVPEELTELIQWSMENGDESVASVDAQGLVIANNVGTAYVIASVTDGEITLTARCRIDVGETEVPEETVAPGEETEPVIKIDGIQLSTTKLTTELFKTDYAAFEILLDLPQNQPEASTYSLRSRNTGVAMVDAAFTDETVDALFDLLVLDDRRVLVVPTDKAIQDAQTNSKSVKGSYSSTVAVIIAGLEEPVETTEKMTLTVKQTKPRLTGKIASFNSFYTGQSQEITISGGTATKISLNADKKNPDWLDLEGNCLILNENAPAKNANVYLNVWTEEWAIPAAVTLSVKNIVKKPSLKLPSSTVIMLKDPSLSSGIELTLKCGSKNDTLEKLNVYNITAPYGYEISDFNQKTGTFRLTPAEGFKAGKINLTVSFSDTESVVILPLTVKTSAVTLKRDKSSITLNRALEDKAVISITATPADYTLKLTEDNLCLTDSKGKTLADDSILDVSVKNNKITVATNGNTPAGTYRIYVSADGSKEVYTTITVVNKTPAVSFKVKGNLDLSFPENSVTLAHSFKNYTGGTYEVVNWTVTEKKGNKVVNADVADLFVLDEENLILSWKEDCYDNLTSGNTYEVTLKLNLPGVVDPVSGKVSLTMKRTSIKLKLEKTSLSLNKLLGDTADVSVSCVTSGYNFTAPMMELWDSRGKTRLDSDDELSANGKLLVTWEDGKIHIELGEDAKFGESFQIRLKANAYSSAYTIKVTIPSESKSRVTVSLNAKGSIDVIRSSTQIVLTPAYKNCMAGKDWDETLWVYTSESKYKTAIPAEELFDITEENGSYIFTAKEGLNPKLKYKVQLVSTLGELEYKSSPVSISVKMGSAKLTMLSSDTTLFAKDKNDRAEMTFTAKDETLNQVKSIAIKDSKYKNLFEIIPYGNGEFAIGFANGVVDSSIRGKTITLNLNVFVEGNDTTTANATMKLKLTVVK